VKIQRVAIVATSLQCLGGAEVFLHCLLDIFQAHGIEVLVCAQDPGDRGQWKPTVIAGLDLGGAMARPDAGHELAHVLGQFRPDVVWVNSTNNHHVLRALRHYRTVRFVHSHGYYCPGQVKYLRATGQCCQISYNPHRCLIRLLLLRCGDARPWRHLSEISRVRRLMELKTHLAGLLVASQHVRSELRRTGHDQPIFCEPLFVDPAVTDPPFIPFDDREDAILFAGRLSPEKGCLLLPSLVHGLSNSTRLYVAGTGHAEHRLRERIARLGLQHRVTFTGWLDRSTTLSLMGRVRATVMPSLWPEPFGLSGLESATMGTPVAAFSVGGIPEWARETGTTLAPPKNISALTATVVRLVSDKHTWHLASQTGRQTMSQYSLTNYSTKLLSWLEQISA